MRRQLNIICILVFLSLGISLLPHLYSMSVGAVAGFKAGWEEAEKSHKYDLSSDNLRPTHLSLMPDFSSVETTVLNLKNNEQLPMQFFEAVVWVKESKRIAPGIMVAFLGMGYMIVVVWAIISFYKLINTINRQVIFDWINVRRLNKLGTLLLLAAFIAFVMNLLDYYSIRGQIELKGHTLNFLQVFDTIFLILGLVSLLVGRIFAMGITLREEQELTI